MIGEKAADLIKWLSKNSSLNPPELS